MTAVHVAALFFQDRQEAAKKRIQKLKRAGLLSSRRWSSIAQSTYSISSDGIAALRRSGALHDHIHLTTKNAARRTSVSHSTLQHELTVMDVKTAIVRAADKSGSLCISRFCTWPKLIQFTSLTREGRTITIKPDGFISMVQKGQRVSRFFLEVDRSTETLDTLVRKAECYLYHYRSGGFARSQNQAERKLKEFPFRVLFVVKSRARLENLLERFLSARPPILTQSLAATSDSVCDNPFGAIWHRAAEFRERTGGTLHLGISIL